MPRRVPSSALALSLVLLALLLTGCPKRPMIPQAAAPAPIPPAAAPAPAPAPLPPAATPVPAPPAPPSATDEFKPNAALKTVYFDFDRSSLRPAAVRILDASAAWLKANPDQLVLIEGNCDERGTNEYNLALGERRAKVAMAHLTARGVDASRIEIVSFGKEKPVCTEHNEACWSKNRRDDFLTKRR